MKQKNCSSWRYLAVVLDDSQKEKLKRFFKDIIPSGWDIHCDHFTVVHNDSTQEATIKKESMKGMLGQSVSLMVSTVGFEQGKALAVGCIGFETVNRHPHITVACAPGVRPKESNNIKTWTPITSFTLTGVLKLI